MKINKIHYRIITLSHYRIIALILFLPIISFAQNDDCSAKLKESARLFDRGMYKQVIDNLAERVKTCDYTKAEHEQAQKLLIASNLELDEIEEGNRLIFKFLKSNPNYVTNQSSDPQPFIQGLQNFVRKPQFIFTFNIGANKLLPQIITKNYLLQSADYNAPYSNNFSFSLSAGLEWMVYNNFALKIDLFDFALHSYQRKISAPYGIDLTYTELFSSVRLPLSLKYTHRNQSKFAPSIHTGFYYSRVQKPTADISVTDTVTGSSHLDKKESGFSTKDFRQINNVGFLIGVGINYFVNSLTFSLNFNYSADLKIFTLPNDNLFKYKPAIDYNYVDDIIRLQTIEITFGISYTFKYKIKLKY